MTLTATTTLQAAITAGYEHWMDYGHDRDRYGEYDPATHTIYGLPTLDNCTLEMRHRFAVSHLRHQATDYDSQLAANMTRDEYVAVKQAVLDDIAEAYPELADECARQGQRAEADWAGYQSRERARRDREAQAAYDEAMAELDAEIEQEMADEEAEITAELIELGLLDDEGCWPEDDETAGKIADYLETRKAA